VGCIRGLCRKSWLGRSARLGVSISLIVALFARPTFLFRGSVSFFSITSATNRQLYPPFHPRHYNQPPTSLAHCTFWSATPPRLFYVSFTDLSVTGPSSCGALTPSFLGFPYRALISPDLSTLRQRRAVAHVGLFSFFSLLCANFSVSCWTSGSIATNPWIPFLFLF